ncbi:putative purple acid phosphatase 20 [Nymphaea thermarum]|nr:putative purple acid phosphatase 20 [Nymphaea thermarum]
MLSRILFLVAVAGIFQLSWGYDRPPPRRNVAVKLADDDDPSPQQVHISLVGRDGMRISWITNDDSLALVEYGTSPWAFDRSATGDTSTYRYFLYKSGQIHNVVIGPLDPDTIYYYRCGGAPNKMYSLKTPPAQLPIKFAVSGDLGQTEWTHSTLQHIAESNYDVLLLPGDLSYADTYQPLWDSFGLLVEPLSSSRPWMVTQGNHEIEKIPLITRHPFKSYNARWRMPYEESNSTSNLYYSFDVPRVHIIMLGSYADYEIGSDQYKWLQADLAKVDRERTPWLIALLHAPWYNSNSAHQGEGEDMRVAMERLLYGAQVNVVFAGHVHAYERTDRVYNGTLDSCGPVHITIGDGGNREGLATEFMDPKPEWSVFREASFGHGVLQVENDTHAGWTWHRNGYDEAVVADRVWLTRSLGRNQCTTNVH